MGGASWPLPSPEVAAAAAVLVEAPWGSGGTGEGGRVISAVRERRMRRAPEGAPPS